MSQLLSNYMLDNLQPHYDHFLPIVRFYWHSVLKNIVRMIEASREDLILDFGCGKKQRLKSYLAGHKVVSYDIVKEYSDIDDYRLLKPHTIICSQVLEHLGEEELSKTIGDFKKMGTKFVISAVPTENLLSLICNLIGRPRCLGEDFRVVDHKLRIEQIHSILSDTFELKKRKNIMTLNVISKWLVQNKRTSENTLCR